MLRTALRLLEGGIKASGILPKALRIRIRALLVKLPDFAQGSSATFRNRLRLLGLMPFDAASTGHQLLKPNVTAHLQAAAIPVRWVDGAAQVLLITTRGRGAWIVPKGWPLGDYPDAETARREAFEEAGVIGWAEPYSLGAFAYWKGSGAKRSFYQAHAFALHVEDVLRDWPERTSRRRCWFSPENALNLVKPDLGALILKAAYSEVSRAALAAR